MSGTKLTDLYEFILPELPKCPKPLVLQNIRTLLRTDFFPQTQVWKYEMDAVDIKDGKTDYDFEWPSKCTDVDTLGLVTIDKVVILPLEDYVMNDFKSLTLVVEPTADTESDQDGLEIQLILKPKMDIDEVPCEYYDNHFQTWAYGVMSKLMKMKNKPWSDKQTGAEYLGYYLDGKGEARIEQNRGRTTATLTARPDYPFA